MALISPFTIIRTISLFHITAAYFFLTAPQIISDQNVVFILGEAMRLPHATSLDTPSEATAFAAILLTFIGVADLTAASLKEATALDYWLSNVPVRLTLLFSLTGYVYLFKEDGVFGPSSMSLDKAGLGEPLLNSMVFTFGFFEIAAWFWVFTGLREERQEISRKLIEKMKGEDDRL